MALRKAEGRVAPALGGRELWREGSGRALLLRADPPQDYSRPRIPPRHSIPPRASSRGLLGLEQLKDSHELLRLGPDSRASARSRPYPAPDTLAPTSGPGPSPSSSTWYNPGKRGAGVRRQAPGAGPHEPSGALRELGGPRAVGARHWRRGALEVPTPRCHSRHRSTYLRVKNHPSFYNLKYLILFVFPPALPSGTFGVRRGTEPAGGGFPAQGRDEVTCTHKLVPYRSRSSWCWALF